jgi:predicted DNA-binding transcriptional regulator AlpA
MENRLCSTLEIAEEFGIADTYLRKLRQLKKGPKYQKLGRMIRYYRRDVEAWLRQALVEVRPDGII